MLRIVTDGAADMPPEWEQEYGIKVLPLGVTFGEELYVPGQNFTRDDFYRMVSERKVIPKSSLPSIGQIKAFYRSVAEAGDTILSIHISSKLSGTYAAFQSAAAELADDFKIIVFDSLAGSAAQAFMAREACLMDRAGAALPQIMRRLEGIRKRISISFTVKTLEYAYLSGRISPLQSLVASALDVKPIIVLRDGLLDVADKVRTRHRALDRVLQNLQDKLGSRKINIAVVHAADPVAALEMCRKVLDMFNVKDAIVADLSIPVAVNLGPGSIGVIAYPDEEED